jgi:hypothetical protein
VEERPTPKKRVNKNQQIMDNIDDALETLGKRKAEKTASEASSSGETFLSLDKIGS